ncbi:MAG: hypothetical protein ABS81_25800 [Pseudonocardia sp. SCN 72-86]|nr:MAG: hypothetical protein ABS81_25800 [Pseudonocardia sp. SCN 72-86]
MTDPRSLLFVPSNRPDRFEKASRSGADAVILDLEDSVGVSQKAVSRDNLQTGADFAAAAGQSVYVRVNPVGTEWHTEDLAAAARINARGVIVPKCEDTDVVDEIDRGLAEGLELFVIMETAKGVLNAAALCRPTHRTRRVSFGAYDFALDMGVVPEQAHPLMTWARIQVAMAAVAGGVQPIDTAFADVRDPDAMRRQTEEAHGMGFTGKFAIHPDQVPIINEVLSPSPEEIDTAQRIVVAFDEAERDGIAAITVDDKLVDYPIAQRAQATLARAAQFGLVTS